MDNLELFFEATALEIFNTKYKPLLGSIQVYLALLGADPTSVIAEGGSPEQSLEASKKGRYSDWVIRQYQKATDKNRFLREDLVGISPALSRYMALTKNKEAQAKLAVLVQDSQLPIKNPLDLNSFTRETLLAVLNPILGQSAVDIGTKDENKVDVIYDDAIWQAVIPLTFRASCKYGTGTTWCTATPSSDGHYKDYSRQGPLVIIRNKVLNAEGKKDCKWQYHKQSHQFKDYTDKGIGIYRIIKQFMEPPADPATIDSTTKLFAALFARGYDLFDPRRVIERVEYDYALVNKALAKNRDITSATVKVNTGEYYKEYSLLQFAVLQQDMDLLNDLIALDVPWKSDQLIAVLVAALKTDTPDLFGNVLKQVADKPFALTKVEKGARASLFAMCTIKGYNWLNMCLLSLTPREQRSVLLSRAHTGQDEVIFCDAMAIGGRKNDVTIADCVPLISNVMKPPKIAEPLVEAQLVLPPQEIPDYFLIGNPSSLQTAQRRGFTNVVAAIKAVLSEEGAQSSAATDLVLETPEQIAMVVETGEYKGWDENVKIRSSNYYLSRILNILAGIDNDDDNNNNDDNSAAPTTSLFSLLGIIILYAKMSQSPKKEQKVYPILLDFIKTKWDLVRKNSQPQIANVKVMKELYYYLGEKIEDSKPAPVDNSRDTAREDFAAEFLPPTLLAIIEFIPGLAKHLLARYRGDGEAPTYKALQFLFTSNKQMQQVVFALGVNPAKIGRTWLLKNPYATWLFIIQKHMSGRVLDPEAVMVLFEYLKPEDFPELISEFTAIVKNTGFSTDKTVLKDFKNEVKDMLNAK